MAKYLVRYRNKKIDTIRLKKKADLKNPYVKEVIKGYKSKGYKLVDAKNVSAVRKPFIKKGYTSIPIKRRKK